MAYSIWPAYSVRSMAIQFLLYAISYTPYTIRRFLRLARAQHLARHCTGVLAVLVEHGAIDHGVLHTLSRHHQAPTTAGQIVAHLPSPRRSDGIRIKDGKVRRCPLGDLPALLESIKCRRLRREPLHRML